MSNVTSEFVKLKAGAGTLHINERLLHSSPRMSEFTRYRLGMPAPGKSPCISQCTGVLKLVSVTTFPCWATGSDVFYLKQAIIGLPMLKRDATIPMGSNLQQLRECWKNLGSI